RENSGDDIARCFPEAALDAPDPGYRPADGAEPVARLSAARAGRKAEVALRAASRRRRLTRLVRATGPQTAVNP
ncbi:hypothetical protein, partial [Klebsiella michiganensis]|uniref:hypothetical protein n=1 Tax=Klebsiella michiganensis TaxID=1134687 RepID=UPI0006664C2D